MRFTHQIVLIDTEVLRTPQGMGKPVFEFRTHGAFNMSARGMFREYAQTRDPNAQFVRTSNLAGGYYRLSNGDALELI